MSSTRHSNWLAFAGLGVGLLSITLLSQMHHGFARHMTTHIVLMGVVAPAIARWLPLRPRRGGRLLLFLAIAQIALLYFWHSPAVFPWAMVSDFRMIAMQASLLVLAVAFWAAVFERYRAASWQSVVAVLATGKLFCLLGALLVFSPRAVYPQAVVSIADQQLAGLIMLTACPLTYIVAAFALTLLKLGALATEPPAAC